MSLHETDLDRYCPLRTDVNGEMRKCVKGCAWWWNGSCAVSRLSVHLELMNERMTETGLAAGDLSENMQDAMNEFNSAVSGVANRMEDAAKILAEKEDDE
jgi:hypothetical protein